jgi:hypothetical protein
MTESQRAMVAAKLASLEHGQRQTGQLAAVPTQTQAAGLLNVGERTVRRAREVIDRGEPEPRPAWEPAGDQGYCPSRCGRRTGCDLR